MLFPIAELLSHEQSVAWIEKYFHPDGLHCPSCGAAREQARPFRTTQRGLLTYRCNRCRSAYNLYSRTIFANSLLPPAKVVLLLRACMSGDKRFSKMVMPCVLKKPCRIRILKPMRCFRMRGKKGEVHAAPSDPPRRRGNKKKGHGTYENDRPPVVGTVGRYSGQCRLQVCQHKEWARDDDGDGLNEVHTNTIAGLWTSLRNWLRPFRGVHKQYLKYYVAMCEHKINLKRISPHFIARLVEHTA